MIGKFRIFIVHQLENDETIYTHTYDIKFNEYEATLRDVINLYNKALLMQLTVTYIP